MSYKIHRGDCREIMQAMQPHSVHLVVTSIPYWGKRSYGTEPQIWGGDPDCNHVWGDELPKRKSCPERDHTHGNRSLGTRGEQGSNAARGAVIGGGNLCSKCGAWKGELGQEPTPSLYVEHIVEVFGYVHRILHPSGTVLLNCDDTYITNPHGPKLTNTADPKFPEGRNRQVEQANRSGQTGIPGKNLALVPQRLMIALQEFGWIVRFDGIWSKGKSFDEDYVGSAMPESAHDRPARSHEYLIMLAKQPGYFWDDEAVRERGVDPGRQRNDRVGGATGHTVRHSKGGMMQASASRKLRSVWEIRNESSGLEHYAMFPRALPRVAIKAGTSERGCCPACLAPWKRIVEKGEPNEAQIKACGANADGGYHGEDRASRDGTGAQSPADAKRNILKGMVERKTVGWRPTCSCDAGEPIPCTVFDPFLGSGTTILEAESLGRDSIGAELLTRYADMARNRIEIAALHGYRDLNIPSRPHKKQIGMFDEADK